MVKETKYAVLTTDGSAFVWDYKEKEMVQLQKDRIPAISAMNDPELIQNSDSVVFPENLDDINPETEKQETDEKISLGSKTIEEEKVTDDDDDEQSILIQKLREHVIRFERLLGKFLDPDLPTSRKLRKKYMEERDLFRKEGYKEFIDAIELKIDALCIYESKYNLDQFNGIDSEDKIREGYFKKKIEDAKKGDFHSAQEVVNSVMQIVIEEEYGVPRRRLVTKIR
ncbi:MAG: hypothetical protein KJI69_04200 [Patescibacteria group bacterium]|nr:hypothetical protein [Patescibacteria group bacterium]